MSQLQKLACGVNQLVTQIHSTITLEHQSQEVTVLDKTFTWTFSQSHCLNQEMKKFGEKEKQVVVTEMKQLHDKAVDTNQLSKKRGTTESCEFAFICHREKHRRISGMITVADGSKQRLSTN